MPAEDAAGLEQPFGLGAPVNVERVAEIAFQSRGRQVSLAGPASLESPVPVARPDAGTRSATADRPSAPLPTRDRWWLAAAAIALLWLGAKLAPMLGDAPSEAAALAEGSSLETAERAPLVSMTSPAQRRSGRGGGPRDRLAEGETPDLAWRPPASPARPSGGGASGAGSSPSRERGGAPAGSVPAADARVGHDAATGRAEASADPRSERPGPAAAPAPRESPAASGATPPQPGETGPSRSPRETLAPAGTLASTAHAARDSYTLEDLRGRPRASSVDARPRPLRLIAPRSLRQLIDPVSGGIEIVQTWMDSLGAERQAVAWVLVDASGTVQEARILRSAGSEELDAKVIRAVRNVSYTPPTRRGAPVPVWTLQSVMFRLE